LRLGWLVVPRHFIEDVISAKFADDFASEALGQLTLARFIDSGSLARHLRHVRPVYRSRRDRLLVELDAHLPQLRPSGEAAGLHLLLRLPAGLDPGTVSEAAADHGIQLEQASWHWADRDEAPSALLIGYGALRESTLAQGIAALGKDLHAA
jgi:GntR family transcriptional regulator/MocR family aminotransferase